MTVKVRKKPVRKGQANQINHTVTAKARVLYDGIHIGGKCYTFGKPCDMWKYAGSIVEIKGNAVFSNQGDLLGYINIPESQKSTNISERKKNMLEYVKTIKQVRNALDALEIKGDALMIEIDGDPTRLQVFVNNEYTGIFDTVKNTFVD